MFLPQIKVFDFVVSISDNDLFNGLSSLFMSKVSYSSTSGNSSSSAKTIPTISSFPKIVDLTESIALFSCISNSESSIF